eukprot:gene26745-4313_t
MSRSLGTSIEQRVQWPVGTLPFQGILPPQQINNWSQEKPCANDVLALVNMVNSTKNGLGSRAVVFSNLPAQQRTIIRLGSARTMWDGNSAGCFPGQNKQLPLLPSGSGLDADQWTALPSLMPNGLPYSGIMIFNFGNGRSAVDTSLSAAINLSNAGGAPGHIAPPAYHRHHSPRQENIVRGESNGSNFPINSTHNIRLPPQQLNFKLGGVQNRANLLTTTNVSSSSQSSSRQPVPSSQLGSSLLADTQLPMPCTQAMPKSRSDNNCQVGAPAAVHNSDKGQGRNTVNNGGSNGSYGSNSNSDEAAPDQLWCKASCGDGGGGNGGTGGSNTNNNSSNINVSGIAKQERLFPSPHLSSSNGGMKRARARDTNKDSGDDENQDQEEDGHKQEGNKRCSGGRPADRLAYACDSARRRQRASKSVGEMDDDAGDACDSDVNSSRQEDPSHRHKTQQKRLLWTPELHYRFLNAVFYLGVNNAAPNYMIKLMNVNGLKRENVASHLQKYRQYLKRVAGVSAKDTISPALLQQNLFGLTESNILPLAAAESCSLNLLNLLLLMNLADESFAADEFCCRILLLNIAAESYILPFAAAESCSLNLLNLFPLAQEVVMREHADVPSMGVPTMGATCQTSHDNMAVGQPMNYAAFPGAMPAANILGGAAVNPLIVQQQQQQPQQQQQQQQALFPKLGQMPQPFPLAQPPLAQSAPEQNF